MRDRLMAGHSPLEAGILVRIQAPQLKLLFDDRNTFKNPRVFLKVIIDY
jgi:hypothetical protein